MDFFDLNEIEPGIKKTDIFFENDNFTSRLIKLEAGDGIPPCKMNVYVVFVIISGQVKIRAKIEDKVDEQEKILEAEQDSRILGIQINTGG